MIENDLKDVSSRLEERKDDCFSQLKENDINNLKQLARQYELYEQQYAQKLKQKSLELQIAELKIKQHEEKLAQEQSLMKSYAEQVSQLLATETSLRLQLTTDGEKFQQFQEALTKSNDVFETFKQDYHLAIIKSRRMMLLLLTNSCIWTMTIGASKNFWRVGTCLICRVHVLGALFFHSYVVL